MRCDSRHEHASRVPVARPSFCVWRQLPHSGGRVKRTNDPAGRSLGGGQTHATFETVENDAQCKSRASALYNREHCPRLPPRAIGVLAAPSGMMPILRHVAPRGVRVPGRIEERVIAIGTLTAGTSLAPQGLALRHASVNELEHLSRLLVWRLPLLDLSGCDKLTNSLRS